MKSIENESTLFSSRLPGEYRAIKWTGGGLDQPPILSSEQDHITRPSSSLTYKAADFILGAS
jgi:hypothetical protein